MMIWYPRSKPIIKNQCKGFNLIGPPPDRGLGLSLTSIYRSLKNLAPVNVIHLPQEKSQKGFSGRKFKSGINLFVGNPDMLIHTLLKHPSLMLRGNYNIGLWFWELEEVPKSWHKLKHWVDEIWVQSDFILRNLKPLSDSIHKIPFHTDIGSYDKFDREMLKLPHKKFIFLFTFDFRSFYQRKNPEAVIQAFKNFFKDEDDAMLLIKSNHGDDYPALKSKLLSMLSGHKNIEYRDEFVTRDIHSSLIYQCDAFVSLHRSEGVGLGLAEAMALGKPVIATNYSGNLEFMNSSNSCLVRYKKVPMKEADYIHSKTQYWAEPDISHAGFLMRKIFTDVQYKNKISRQAQVSMKQFSQKNQEAAVFDRVKAIYA